MGRLRTHIDLAAHIEAAGDDPILWRQVELPFWITELMLTLREAVVERYGIEGLETLRDSSLWESVDREPQQRRVSIPQSVRREIFERDRYRCVACESWSHLQIDHIVPVSAGGTDEPGNLQTLCRSCNMSKKDSLTWVGGQ